MYLADLFAAGLAIGCAYSLVALGFAMIIRATGIIHFAQGELPAGLRHYRSDIEEQTRFTMQILTEQLEANETDWAHCHHVRLYLTEPRRDYRAFARVWREYFPDPARAPALAFVPSTGIMFDGPVIEIDPTCVVRA
jgi:enamine deaminase RidA (YjgF/YER057c/UK114 family)